MRAAAVAHNSVNRPAETFTECLRCPARCPDQATYEAHLAERHLYSPSVAQAIARGLYLVCCDRIGPEHAPTCVPNNRPRSMTTVPPTEAQEAQLMAGLSTPVPCKHCKKPYVRTGYRQLYCPACAKTACKKCGRVGAHSPTCPRAGRPTSGNKKPAAAKKPKPAAKPKPAPRVKPAHDVKPPAGWLARIEGLKQAVAAGERAQAELDELRVALGSA